jgi:hypothetical protein
MTDIKEQEQPERVVDVAPLNADGQEAISIIDAKPVEDSEPAPGGHRNKCWAGLLFQRFPGACCLRHKKGNTGVPGCHTAGGPHITPLCTHVKNGRLEKLTADWSMDDRERLRATIRAHATVTGLIGFILGMILMSILTPSMPRIIDVMPAPIIKPDVENTPLTPMPGLHVAPPLRMQGLPTRPGSGRVTNIG